MKKIKWEELADLVLLQAETVRWLEQCPQPRADGIFETVQTLVDRQREEIVLLSMESKDEALVETVRGFVDEGELPLKNNCTEYMEEAEFWDAVLEMVKERIERIK
jgi:hypothetical protein